MNRLFERTVYIAGKMTGLPDHGRKRFEDAEAILRARGYIVLNPAILPEGLEKEKYMPICLAMLDAADCVYALRNWEDSLGAKLEIQYARYQGKKVYFEREEDETL